MPAQRTYGVPGSDVAELDAATPRVGHLRGVRPACAREACASYVTGGPEESLTAVANIVLGATDAQAEFEAEPTVYRWIFHRRGTDVDIRLLQVVSGRLPDDAGTIVWTSRQTIDTLARAVLRAFDSVVAEHGEDGYETTWGRPFPSIEVNALRTAWRKPDQAVHPRYHQRQIRAPRQSITAICQASSAVVPGGFKRSVQRIH
jgi:hypothetical protein